MKKEEKVTMACKRCKTGMDKVYVFSGNISYQQWKCPNCGAATAKRTIEYDAKGNIERRGGKVLHG